MAKNFRSDPSIRWDAADQLQTDKLQKNSSGAAAAYHRMLERRNTKKTKENHSGAASARQRMLDRRNKGIVKNEP